MTGEMGACWEEMKGCHGDIAKNHTGYCMCGHVTDVWLNCSYARAPAHQRTLNLNRW